MKDNDIINSLTAIGDKQVQTPAHREALKSALLSAYQKEKSRPFVINLFSFTMKRTYAAVGAFAIVAVIFSAVLPTANSPHAQAQEQLSRSYARAVEISPEMRAQLEEKMKADMLETLKEAKVAPDLRVLTKEEYEKESALTWHTGPGIAAMTTGLPVGAGVKPIAFAQKFSTADEVVNIQGESGVSFTKAEAVAGEVTGNATFTVSASAAMPVSAVGTVTAGTFVAGGINSFSEPVKYLSYTDPQGHKTVLGLDENDTPVFKMTTLTESDVVPMPGGGVQIQGKVLKMINAAATETE